MTTEPVVLPPVEQPPSRRRSRWMVAGLVAGLLVAAGIGVGLASSLAGSPERLPLTAASFGYYQSVLGRYGHGSMMNGGPGGSMMGRPGYAWMMGGADAPGWQRGSGLPGYMAGSEHDPGAVMGRLFAGAPGPRVSAAEASRLGEAVPAGATADRAGNRLVVGARSVRLVVLASPSMPSENFRIAGMTNPTVVVPDGAQVSIELVNADADMAHGLVVTASGAASWRMPMMAGGPAFEGAGVWFLGASTASGMHTGQFSFTASAPGTYQYVCPVPGHAREGMAGTFVVSTRA